METLQGLPVIDLQNIQPSIASANDLALSIINAVLDGRINPLDFAVKKKCIEEALDTAFSNTKVKDAMIEEAQKSGGKLSHLGAKVEVAEVGVKYFFDKTGDPKLDTLEIQAAELAERIKQRKEYLKKVDGKGEQLVVDDEVVTVFPPYRMSSTSLKVSLVK